MGTACQESEKGEDTIIDNSLREHRTRTTMETAGAMLSILFRVTKRTGNEVEELKETSFRRVQGC